MGAMVGLAVMEVPVLIGGLGRFSEPLMGPSKDNLAPCSGTPSIGSPSDRTWEVSFNDANSRDRMAFSECDVGLLVHQTKPPSFGTVSVLCRSSPSSSRNASEFLALCISSQLIQFSR